MGHKTTRRSINIFIAGIALEIAIGLIATIVEGTSLDALQATTRFSGRASLLFFSLMLIFRRNSNQSRWTSEQPFLLFAILHGIHLIELLFFVALSGRDLVPIRLLGGFVAYMIIFLLPLAIKFHVSERILIILKHIYFPYIWFIFFMSYLPRVTGSLKNVGGAYWEHVTLFVFVIIIGLTGLLYRPKLVTASIQQS